MRSQEEIDAINEKSKAEYNVSGKAIFLSDEQYKRYVEERRTSPGFKESYLDYRDWHLEGFIKVIYDLEENNT